MRKHVLALLCACFFLSLSACGSFSPDAVSTPSPESPAPEPSSPPEPIVAATSTYTDRGVQFDYPSSWELTPTQTEDIFYTSFSDSAADSGSVFMYSVGEAWLTDFNRAEEDYEQLLAEACPDISVSDLTKTAIDGYEAVKLMFTYSSQDTEYTVIRYETIVGYASYQFSFTYPTAAGNDLENAFEAVIASVGFI